MLLFKIRLVSSVSFLETTMQKKCIFIWGVNKVHNCEAWNWVTKLPVAWCTTKIKKVFLSLEIVSTQLFSNSENITVTISYVCKTSFEAIY